MENLQQIASRYACGIWSAYRVPEQEAAEGAGTITCLMRTMQSTPVRMTLKWCVPHGECRPIVSALQGIMLLTRAEAGCIGCSLQTDMHDQDETLIRYVEEWKDEEDLARQLRSERFGGLAELMERASKFPIVLFDLPGSTRGADYAEEIRALEAN